MEFIKNLLSNDLILFILILAGFVILFFVFLLIQARIIRKAQEKVMRELVRSQEAFFTNAADQLSEKLTVYTDGALVEKVNNIYSGLLSENLLPQVNEAAKTVSMLSEAVVRRQEDGMTELADMLADLFASKTREYIRQETETIASLQETTAAFSKNLSEMSENINQLSFRFGNVYDQTTAVAATVSEAGEILAEKVGALGAMFDSAAGSFAAIQSQISENKDTVLALSETTERVQQLAERSAFLLADQNERTAGLFNDAISSMQQSAELSAKTVASELSMNLGTTAELINNTVANLSEIAQSINRSAEKFASGISTSYNDFGNQINERLAGVTQSLSDSISDQCQKIAQSTETCSNVFVQNITQLSEALQGHITNLQFITQQLNNNVTSFNETVDLSSSKFEVGMEKSISEALSQMDSSLAEIVRRLVAVTSNIQEAADALPKAVKSLTNG